MLVVLHIVLGTSVLAKSTDQFFIFGFKKNIVNL